MLAHLDSIIFIVLFRRYFFNSQSASVISTLRTYSMVNGQRRNLSMLLMSAVGLCHGFFFWQFSFLTACV